MKLLFVIIQKEDTKPLTDELIDNDFSVTRISSTGGFLSGGNTTLMIGLEPERIDRCLEIIKEKSSRRRSITVPVTMQPRAMDATATPFSVTVGGATVFVIDAESFYKF